MKAPHGRLVAIGTALVFVGAVRTLDGLGVENAVQLGFVAAMIAIFITWAISP